MRCHDVVTCNVLLQWLVKHVANSNWFDYLSAHQAASVNTYFNVNHCIYVGAGKADLHGLTTNNAWKIAIFPYFRPWTRTTV